MELSWKPKRNGLLYCAPACGLKCTYEAYKKANKDGRALARRLGKSWKVRVWENLGWHYNAIDRTGYWKIYANITKERTYRRGVEVWVPRIRGYTAFFGPSKDCGGRWAESGATPEEAIKNIRDRFIEETQEMHKLQLAILAVEVRRGFG